MLTPRSLFRTRLAGLFLSTLFILLVVLVGGGGSQEEGAQEPISGSFVGITSDLDTFVAVVADEAAQGAGWCRRPSILSDIGASF